jgi:hypothetical protein
MVFLSGGHAAHTTQGLPSKEFLENPPVPCTVAGLVTLPAIVLVRDLKIEAL